MGRVERLLMVLTPAVAMAAVVLGLRIGAGEKVRAAMVYGAPDSRAGVGQAWQLVVFDEERGIRQPVRLDGLEIVAHAGTSQVSWQLSTNEDGAAELALPLKQAPDRVEVTAGGKVLVSGQPAAGPKPAPPPPLSAWARFARRSGPISLDVALLGQRAASGFPANVWVRARDESTGEPRDGIAITVESDPAITPAEPKVTTELWGGRTWSSRRWASRCRSSCTPSTRGRAPAHPRRTPVTGPGASSSPRAPRASTCRIATPPGCPSRSR
jgi:hypothetical protein